MASQMEELHRPIYMTEVLVNALNQGSDRPLLQLLDGATLSVTQVRDAVSGFAQGLQALGFRPGMHASILSSNRPEVLFVGYALNLLSAITASMHPRASLADHLHVLRDAKIEVLVYDPEHYAERAQELAAAIPGLKLLALGEGDAPDLCAAAARATPAPLVAPRAEANDVTRFIYSGGTTGKPKSLLSTEQSSLACFNIMMAEWEWPSPPRVLSCAPLSHAGGAMFIPTVLKGGTMLIHPGFDPTAVLEAIQEHRINCMMLVPTMIYALLDHPRLDEFDLSSLETIFYGASSISPARLKEAIERIGPVFFQFYGQAEAPMTVTVMRKADHDVNDMRRLASCGRPAPWINVALLDSDDRPVPDGEPGEICVRGPIVFDGYRDQPELTAETFSGGWLHTGDVAVRDPDGFLRIVDRKKDMIVTGGFNVYPREVEDVIATHPAVSQVAVIGQPHPRWGEAVMALVVLQPGKTADADELTAMVAQRKGAFQAPKIVEFIDSIPQTPVGKPDKKALRAIYARPPEPVA